MSPYTILTPEQIERIAESEMNRLDDRLITGRIDQGAYDHLTKKLDAWVEQEYAVNREAVLPCK